MKEFPHNTPSPETKNEGKKYIFILIGYFVVVIVYMYISVFFRSHQEYNTKYDFVIEEVEADIKGNLIFHDTLDNEYSFASYSFSKFSNLGIKAGDKLFKDYHSKNMVFSRMIGDEYKVYYI